MSSARDEESNKIYVEQTHNERLEFIRSLGEYGNLTLKSLTLLHGGAVVALIALTGSVYEKVKGPAFSIFLKGLTDAGSFFVGGLVLCVVCAAAGYLNFTALAQITYSPGELREWYRGTQPRQHSKLLRAMPAATAGFALFCGLISLSLFIWGAWLVKVALLALPAPT